MITDRATPHPPRRHWPAFLFALLCLIPFPSPAQDSADEARLRALLDEFLAAASLDDRAMHERFWADDLVYTSSSGRRFGKAEILAGLEAGTDTAEPPMRYWAEDAEVKLFGDTAVVTFRLVGEQRTRPGADPETAYYFNTGTFVRRDGEWRAVAWQATRIPPDLP